MVLRKPIHSLDSPREKNIALESGMDFNKLLNKSDKFRYRIFLNLKVHCKSILCYKTK